MQTQQSRTPTEHPPTRANLRAWWSGFNFPQKPKKEAMGGPYRPLDTADHPVFGKSLKESLKYANVQISTADANGRLYVWGYIPVVVAKCGLYLKEHATEVQGTFRVNGSTKRMRELQAAFESPPRYGKNLDWRKEYYTSHDVASVFRRYLTQMPEPVIPHDMYHIFRDTLAKQPHNQEEAITTYKSLIRRMPKPNQYLLLYVLDLLSVFARKSEKNFMTATNLAVIFRPGLISHPEHERSPHEHNLSQRVLEFLIAQQDWFMLDISPPTPGELAENGNRNGQGPGAVMGVGKYESPSVRWPESTNTPTASWKATAISGLDGEVPARNPNPEAGPSTLRQRAASASAWSSGLPTPTPPQIQSDLGQLTEQITPTSSVPSSPVQPHFDKPKPSAVLGQSSSNPDIGSAHGLTQPRRPSSPLNLSYLPSQANHPPSHSTPLRPGSPGGSLYSDVDELMVIPAGTSLKSAEEEDTGSSFVPGGGGWKILGRNVGSGGLMEAAHGWGNMQHTSGPGGGGGHVGGFMALGGSKKDKKDKEIEEKRIKVTRRRTTMDRSVVIPHGTITPIEENPLDSDLTAGNRLSSSTIQRSRTLPTRRKDKLHSAEDLASGAVTDKENEKSGSGIWSRRREKDKGKDKEKPKGLLRKHRPRASGHGQAPSSSSTATSASLFTSPISSSPVPSPGVHGNRTLGSPLVVGREKEPIIGEESRS